MKSRHSRVVAGSILALLMIGCGGAERNGAGDAGDLAGGPAVSADPAGGAATAGPGREGEGGAAAGPGTTAGTAPGAGGAGPGAGAAGGATTPELQREGVVLFVGTSLTAGYGLSPDQAFPSVVQQRIQAAGLPFQVVNAGVSGETSAGALRRIDWLLQQPFDVLVLETGANDMLRGIDPAAAEQNIQTIIDRVRERRPHARIVLAGMLAVPNLGPEYRERFESIYPRLAERNRLTLIPFILEGVAAQRELNLADGIHPNAEGQRRVAETVWEWLEPELRAMAIAS